MKFTKIISLLALSVALFLFSQGCSPPPAENNNVNLTDAEQNAVLRCAQAAKLLATAGCITQTGSDQMSLPTARTAGTCPQVTLELGTISGSMSALLDFGVAGCTPVFMPGVTVAGSVIGTLMPTSQSLSLGFSGFTMNSNSLSGTVNIAFQLTGHTLAMEGNWYLDTWVSEASTHTEGEGTIAYNGDTYATTISTFTGSVTRETDTWQVTMSNIQVSYATYHSFIPYGGEMTITGATIRPFTIRFNTSSPTTGQVEVSYIGTTWATVNLWTLFASL